MTSALNKYIKTGDFCEIVTDKFADQGVKRGHLVYVAGYKALPIAEEDPYTQRIKFLVHLYNSDKAEMGKELHIMDPISILPVDEKEQAHLLADYKLANGID